MLQRYDVLAGFRYGAMLVGAAASALAIDQTLLQPDASTEITLEAAAGPPPQLGGIATANCLGANLNTPVCIQNPLEQAATTTSSTTTTLPIERSAPVRASRSEPRPPITTTSIVSPDTSNPNASSNTTVAMTPNPNTSTFYTPPRPEDAPITDYNIKVQLMSEGGIAPGDYKHVDYIFGEESTWIVDNVSPNKCIGLGQNCLNEKTKTYWLYIACPEWRNDPVCQIRRFDVYAKERYHSWEEAARVKRTTGSW